MTTTKLTIAGIFEKWYVQALEGDNGFHDIRVDCVMQTISDASIDSQNTRWTFADGSVFDDETARAIVKGAR